MLIHHRIEGQICILQCEESFYGPGVRDFREYLKGNGMLSNESIRCILINFRDVDYIDSSAIGLLVSLWQQLNKKQAVLAFCELNDKLTRLIKMSSFYELVKIYPSEEESLKDEMLIEP